MYKVFLKDRIVFFLESTQDVSGDTGKGIRVCTSPDQVEYALDEFIASSGIQRLYFVREDIGVLKKRFLELCSPITAAGGIIFNEKEEILFIKRNGLWDLPKGKIDKGESPEECAYREVKEETGVKNLNIIRSGEITYHIYLLNGELILKDTHWFLMKAPSDQHFLPQHKENITQVKWMHREAFKKVQEETFPLIWDLINNFILLP